MSFWVTLPKASKISEPYIINSPRKYTVLSQRPAISNSPKIENHAGMVVTSTKNLIAGARKKHIDKINNIEEAEFKVKE